jgi:hypothetical protein
MNCPYKSSFFGSRADICPSIDTSAFKIVRAICGAGHPFLVFIDIACRGLWQGIGGVVAFYEAMP